LIQGWLSHEAAGKLFATAGLSLDELSQAASAAWLQPVALKLTANLTLHNQVQSIVSRNAVALVKGSRHPHRWCLTRTGINFGTKPRAGWQAADLPRRPSTTDPASPAYWNWRGFTPRPNSTGPQRTVHRYYVGGTGPAGRPRITQPPAVPAVKHVADLNMDVMNVYGETRDLTVRGSSCPPWTTSCSRPPSGRD